MKKLLHLLLTVLVLVGLAACGKGEDEVQEKEVQEKEVEEVKEVNSVEGQAEEGTIDYPQLSSDVADNEELVVMNTTLGQIKIKLFPEIAPKTVENFLTHAENGYYDGLIFHRVMEEFMIQGGDPEGTGRGGESIFGDSFEDEFSDQVFNLRGALSMANAGPNTNGSQFFIVQNTQVNEGALNEEKELIYPDMIKQAYSEKGGTPHLDQAHTVFGQVIEGMDTVDKIARVKEKGSKPIEDVVIKSIDILTKK